MTNWKTPRILYDELDRSVGGFLCDAAADHGNSLHGSFYGPGSAIGEDALVIERWLSPAFCNPPYGKGIEKWLMKFIEQAKLGVTTVALLPARVETRWWYDYVVAMASIVFLVGRVPFIDVSRTKPTQPDHGSAVCLFEPELHGGNVCWLDWKARITARELGNQLRNGTVVSAGSLVGGTIDNLESRGSSVPNSLGGV